MKEQKNNDLVEFCFSITINANEIYQTDKEIKLEQDEKMFLANKLNTENNIRKDKIDWPISEEITNHQHTRSSTSKEVKIEDKLDNISSSSFITPPKLQKSFICAFEGCGKRFDYKWIHDRHINSHFCFKLHKCDYEGCDKAYKSRENLNLHIKNKHLGEKPYQCRYCDSRFSHRNGIKIY